MKGDISVVIEMSRGEYLPYIQIEQADGSQILCEYNSEMYNDAIKEFKEKHWSHAVYKTLRAACENEKIQLLMQGDGGEAYRETIQDRAVVAGIEAGLHHTQL